MIIGDPFKFSIFIDIVEEWSCNRFVAGIFYIFIGGYSLPRILVNTTLNSEIYTFFNQKRSVLLIKPINLDLFYEEKEQTFRKLLKITYPDPKGEIDNNYLYAS